ncbi:hypothetical protein CLAFUW4_20055 [Fulvia fulva]|uniref:uncharacterized protein n=1 Tax=Passalora fulva TaxID=5499 RepID=UPI0028527C60|nr:uncharacterized protein CLAFUR5_20055 [Fulvia fulva]KAK4621692.1 hypothetical protein CLAFUR4_20055 [Fulvia fulva]KAK4623471.1 hypothetical protein CLAFUR0_20055 [Fulvia fulva]WMI38930.1 hypothetical protein CLAFUR5_20055 [Fulvia fulva]WPV16362.1 hypothetical protein CLAFUW4_20055 [Fulvia fulva]WPV31102.1 hypothetical protein CLAFUW7_20055 [Fulvia fulva]
MASLRLLRLLRLLCSFLFIWSGNHIKVRGHFIVLATMSSTPLRPSGGSLYNTCDAGNILISVDTDDVKILRPAADMPKRAIGTRHLNGCSCVVISGDVVLLAHI